MKFNWNNEVPSLIRPRNPTIHCGGRNGEAYKAFSSAMKTGPIFHPKQVRFIVTHALLVFGIALFSACSVDSPEPVSPRPQQAGQPIDPVVTAARLAAVRGAAMLGDQKAVEANARAMQEDFRKSIKLADPLRAVDRESARVAAKGIAGVRSAIWLDRENLFAIVERNDQRSYHTIDKICLVLEPLGDTLGVVVNLQSDAARNGDELEILSRNCQLAPGDRAFMQRERKVDVLDPMIRAQHAIDKTGAASHGDETASNAESMKVLEATTPELKR